MSARNWRAGRATALAVLAATSTPSLVRRARVLVLRTLSNPSLASWANVAVGVAVLYVLYHTLLVLHKATLVMAGEVLPCLVK